MPKSLLPKIKNIYIDEREFTNDSKELVKYKRLAIEITVDGETEVLDFQPTDALGKAGYTLLRVADDVKKTVA